MKANFLVVLLGCLLAPAIASPAPRSLQESNTTLSERGIPAWQFYYNANAAEQQANFNKWSGSGYRPISLSVYGQPPNHLYAEVWVQRSGPSYYAIHEANGAEYQSFFNTHAANGYASTMISVTGPANGEIFAGVMEQNGVTNWYQSCGMSYDEYLQALMDGIGNSYVLKSFTEYGSSSARLYCGIWYFSNPAVLDPTFIDETYSAYQTTFNLETGGGDHPSYFALSEDHLISSEFSNTNIGSWFARHAMTASDLQAEYLVQEAAGLYITQLQGGGTGSNANFIALWAQTDIPI